MSRSIRLVVNMSGIVLCSGIREIGEFELRVEYRVAILDFIERL